MLPLVSSSIVSMLVSLPSALLLKFACWQGSSLTKGGCILSLVRRRYALAQARCHIKGAESTLADERLMDVQQRGGRGLTQRCST